MDLVESPNCIKYELEPELKNSNLVDPFVIGSTKCGEIYISNNGEFQLKCFICDKQYEKAYIFCKHIFKDHKNIEMNQSLIDFCKVIVETDNSYLESESLNIVKTQVLKNETEDDEIAIILKQPELQIYSETLNSSNFSTEEEDPLTQSRTRTQTRSTMYKIKKLEKGEKLKTLFECPYCEQKFKKKINLRKHVDHKHADKKRKQNVDVTNEKTILKDTKTLDWTPLLDNTSNEKKCDKIEDKEDEDEKQKINLNSKNIKINCKLCGKETPKNKLSQHLRSHDYSRYTYKCNECGKLFISEKSLDIHVKNLHLKEKPFRCNIDNCNRSFVTEHALTAHQKLHSTERPYQCPHCLKEFLHKSKLTYHIKVYHDTGIIINCDECDKQFYDMYTLEKHKVCYHIDNNKSGPESYLNEAKSIENVEDIVKDDTNNIKIDKKLNNNDDHLLNLINSETNVDQSFQINNNESSIEERKRRPGTYECIYCELKFIYKSNLREHINRKHSDKNIKNEDNLVDSSESDNTDEKKKRRVSKKSLNNKKTQINQSQRSQEKLICDICGKETVKYKMVQHLRSHDNTRYTHKCETCGKLFISDKSLQIHMKNYHLKDRPFACSYEHCNKTFATENALTAHNILHTSERPFKCSICQKGFVRKSKMEYHIKTYHVNGRIFKCDECGKRFYEIHTLQVHKICHSNEKPFACDECPARFPRERSLAWHKQSHSGVKPYVCKVCGKEYALYNGIYSHMKTHGIKYSLAFERGEVNIQDLFDTALATGTANDIESIPDNEQKS